jgi:hypothetical protein
MVIGRFHSVLRPYHYRYRGYEKAQPTRYVGSGVHTDLEPIFFGIPRSDTDRAGSGGGNPDTSVGNRKSDVTGLARFR